MVSDRVNFLRIASDADNYQIFKLPNYLESYVKKCGLSELFRPLFARFVLFRFHRFQIALNAGSYPFDRLHEKKIQIPTLNDQNFDELIGFNSDLNLIFFEKDWRNINNKRFGNFESFLSSQNKYLTNAVKLKQYFWSKLFGWPRIIKTDFSINAFTISDILKGSFFLPTKTIKVEKKSIRLNNEFWSMSLLDEFCFLIGNNNILLQANTKRNTRKIISSKSYFNSYKSRETFIKLIGDNMFGTITRHGGIPSHVFDDSIFMANACGKAFNQKFHKEKFRSRYGQIKVHDSPKALIGLYDQSPFTCRFRTGMTRWQFLNQYVPDQEKFFELAKTNKYENNLCFREPRRTLDPYLKNFSGAVTDTNHDIRKSLSEYGLFVITYDSSLPLFLVENDLPFFLFWRKEHWPFWDEKMYTFLRVSGLYHETPETLNTSLINYFQYGQNDWKKKYGRAATEYKNFLRSVYVENY